MEHKPSANTTQSSKALFVLLLLPLSSVVALIAYAIRGWLGTYAFLNLFEDLVFFFILLSFLFIKTKRKMALSFAITATLFQLFSSIINFYNSTAGFFLIEAYIQSIPNCVFPLLLCILLVIYCVSPRSSRCYLFSGIIGCGLLILNVLCVFYGINPAYHGDAVLFLLGFFTNGDVAAQVVKPKQKKTDVSSALDKLEKFAQLKEEGILTAEEFEAKKQELMNQM